MRRALAIGAVVLLTAPASALAAPFGELPFRPVNGAATCLNATGSPGELVRWTPRGAELLQASATGLAPVATIPLGSLGTCLDAETHPGGGGVVAGLGEGGLRVAVRDPGGAFSDPVTPYRGVGLFAAAASPRGDAVVAWTEPASPERATLRVARRGPGGTFGPPETLLADARIYAGLDVAVTGDGEALVVFSLRDGVRVTGARPGARFGAARPFPGAESFAEGALAANPDGRVLLAIPGSNRVTVFERVPGGDFVALPALAGGADSGVALALRPDGGAVIAWQDGVRRETVRAAIRDGAGAFSQPIHVAGPEREDSLSELGAGTYLSDGPPLDGLTLRAAFGPDGRALLAWGGEGGRAQLATVTAAGVTERHPFGGPVRDAFGTTPLLLADGTRAVAWTDRTTAFARGPFAGRVHLAIEGAADAITAPPPALRVGAPRDPTLRPGQALVLPVRCDAACDVRAKVGHNVQGVSIPRAGTALLRFEPYERAIAPRRPGPVGIRLTWSAPGARESRSREASVRLRRLPAPPVPRIENLRARRLEGGAVEVRWTTDVPTPDVFYGVYGTQNRSFARPGAIAVEVALGGPRRRTFRVRLEDAPTARYVHVHLFQRVGRERPSERVRIER